jgi:hypothetical protein
MFRTKLLPPIMLYPDHAGFYGDELLDPHPTPKLEDHPSSAVGDCLFDTFAATLHIYRSASPSASRGHAMQ